MWEKDKQLIAAYRECMKAAIEEMKGGEEVDWDSTCNSEAQKLGSYTMFQYSQWQDDHPSKLDEKTQRFYTPKLPYFQHF